MNLIGKRTTWLKKDDELSIVISSAETRNSAYFWLGWDILWLVCGIYFFSRYLEEADSERKIYYSVFAAFWIYFMFRGIRAFLWKLKGREVIRITGDSLILGKRIFKKGSALKMQMEGIRELKLLGDKETSPAAIFRSLDIFSSKESLSLQYYGREYRFGDALNPDDASAIMNLLIKEIKRRKSSH